MEQPGARTYAVYSFHVQPAKQRRSVVYPGVTLAPWQARLELGFSSGVSPWGDASASRTVLSHRRHLGPLRIQKPLYPEGQAVCHAVILHPPAGIAGGDLLDIHVRLEAGAHAVISTPSAAKWYKSHGPSAKQTTVIELGPCTRLDWLPQENLFFDNARAEVGFILKAHPSAAAIGWDATMLGRQARGERFQGGVLGLSNAIECDGRTLWREQGRIEGGDFLLDSVTGLSGMPVMASLWALGSACTATLAQTVGASLPWSQQLRAGSTALPGGLLLVRVVGREMEPVRALLESLWTRLRPIVLNTAARPLRLWAS